MKQLINYSLHSATVNKRIRPNTFTIIAKSIVIPAMLFLSMQSFAQSTNTAKKDLLKEKREISGKLRTIKKEEHKEKAIAAKNIVQVETINLFNRDFSAAQNTQWKSTKGYDEADFTLNGINMMAFYDADNELMGTGKYVDYSIIPAKAKQQIASDFKGYTPAGQVMYYDDNEKNDDDLNFWGAGITEDAYYIMLKNNNNKEIVVQATTDGNTGIFSQVKKK